jgi:hypothetical protein
MEFRQWLENEESQEQGADGKYWVRTGDLDVMKGKLEKLNRRAAKLKMPPVTMSALGQKVVKEVSPDGRRYDVAMTEIELVGAAPKIKGWTFVARIVHGEGGNMIMGAPGNEVPSKYRTAPPSCDHCRSARKRKDTFVVRSDAGEYKQVGTNCLRDFLGTEDPAAYVLYFSELKRLTDDLERDSDGGGRGRGSKEVETVDFLATTLAVIRKFGFVSKRVSDERQVSTTSSKVLTYFFDLSPEGQKYRAVVDEARRPDDTENAEKMIAWARSLKDAGNDELEDYLWNLSVAAEKLTVDPKTAGLMASLPSSYNRANGTSSSRPGRTPAEAPPAPTLKAGDKFEGVLTVVTVRTWENAYGVTTLHVMKDDAGQVYKWKASKESLDEGSKVRIKGTVKGVEPDRYNNNIPTVELTRCKVVNVVVGEEEGATAAQKDVLDKRWKELADSDSIEPYVTIGRNNFRRLTDEEISGLSTRVAMKAYRERGGDPEALADKLKNHAPAQIRSHGTAEMALDAERLEAASEYLEKEAGNWSNHMSSVRRAIASLPPENAAAAERIAKETFEKMDGLKKEVDEFLSVLRSKQVSDVLDELKVLADKLWSIHVLEIRTKGRSVEKGS